MFRALLALPQEVLPKRHLVYGQSGMSVGCTRVKVKLLKVKPPEDEQVMLETCRDLDS
jgi:hypothetical protein